MQPQKVKIESLMLDPNNAMTHPEENLKAIKESLSQFGQRKNIVVRNGVIIAGNGTVMAARELGWDEVWIDDASHLTEQEAKAYALADNRTAQLGVWDNDKLGEQLQELYEDGYAIADIGFDDVGKVGEADLPDIEDADEPECQQMTFTMHRDQVEKVSELLSRVKKEVKPEYPGNENSNGNALYYIVSKFNG